MVEYFKNFIRTKKKIIFLIYLYCISLVFVLKNFKLWLEPPIQPAISHSLSMPSDDGFVWKDTEKGIILQEIHNPYINQLEIGDILLKVDQQPVFFSESLNEILKSLPPGSVLMYQIQRPSTNYELIQVLVRTFPKVIFKPEKKLFQWIYEILNIACLFAGILLILLLYPFLNRANEIFYHYLGTIFLIIFNLTYLILDLQPTIYQENTEIYFNYFGWIFIFIFLLLTTFAFRRHAFHADFLIDFALLLYLFYPAIFQKNLISYQQEIQVAIILTTLKSLLFYFYKQNFRLFHWALSIICMLASIILILSPNSFTFSFLWIFILTFESYWIYKYLKISKVNLVVQQFLLIIIMITVFSITYSLSHFITNPFPFDFQNIIRIILSFTTSVLVVYLIFLNKNWWKKWLFFSFESRSERLQKFQLSMMNYPNKELLLEDFKKEIYYFLGDVRLEIYLEIDEKNPLYHLLPYFHANNFWAHSKELLKEPINIPSNLLQSYKSDFELIFPLVFSNGKKGLILIGKKKEGYFNLEEVELIQRTIIQLTLIINLLSLLEKEKILVQKTLEANLTALRSQINPHFLFNTLNTISSLIHDSPDLAEEAVEHLSFIFRYTLKTSTEQFATLKDEMQLIKHYLDIEKIRFGKRLTIEIQIDENCMDALIPSLVIQTLVENCIKHGISKLTKGGLIKIQFYQEENYLVGLIYDNGPGIKKENIHKGTGLNNILTRLEQIYSKNHEIKFENTGEGTLVTLRIPLKK